MLNKLFLPSISILLVYGFWISPEFSVIAAGIAIFLLGMVYLEQGFKVFTGGLLEKLLHRTTDKLWKSVSFGVFSTALLQSSSLVSVIIISFLSAGLIKLNQGIGIVLGANIGSTAGAWLVALFGLKIKLSAYAMPMLVLGLMLKFQSGKKISGLGYLLLGVGFLLLGIHYMKDGFEAFSSELDLARFQMEGLAGVLIYIFIGLAATVIMQSTNATMVLVFSALIAGNLSYTNAIAVAIGSNIGTTVTAVLGALSASAEGKRLAAAHLIFNVVTAVTAVTFLPQLILAVDSISSLMSIDDQDYTLKLAVFHSIFNIMGVLLILPFFKVMVAWLDSLFDKSDSRELLDLEHETRTSAFERAYYLNRAVFSYPDAALRAMRKECAHLYRNTLEIISYAIYLSGEKLRESDDLEELVNNWVRPQQDWTIDELYQRHVKGVYADIIRFAGTLEGRMTPKQASQLFAIKVASRGFVQSIKQVALIYENVGEHVKSDNRQVREQYNLLRLRVARVLKQIDELGVGRKHDEILSRARRLKRVLHRQDTQTNNRLNELLRGRQVDSYIASSLLNDSAHIHDACTSLIDSAVAILTGVSEEVGLYEANAYTGFQSRMQEQE
ncbi:Na/Pi cotransporter family protein [Spongorhabdus nitratireducens]